MKRAGLVLLAIIVLLPLAVFLGGGALLDSAPVRARIAAAVERATGHPLRINGPIRLAWSLAPTIEASDVALLNPPGFSRAEFASLRRLAIQLPLLPLLSGRVEARSVVLDHPDIRLETDASGRGNWLPPPAPQPSPAPAGSARPRNSIQIDRLTINDARLQWRSAPPVTISTLTLAPAGGPIEGRLAFNGVPFTLKGQSGQINQTPAPVELSAVGGGLALSVAGQVGGTLNLTLLAPDTAALQPLLGRPVPSVKGVELAAQAGPAGLRSIHLKAAPSDLGALLPGLQLTRLSLDAPALDQPARLVAEARLRQLPMSLAFNIDSLNALTRGGPVPFQALILTDGGSLSGQGTLASPSDPALAVAVAAKIPDLHRTGALAGASLPALQDITFDAHLLPLPNGPGLVARALRFASKQGDVAGDLAFGATPRPSLRGTLVSHRLDLDALSPPAGPPPPPAAAPALSPASPASPPPPGFMDRPLPFAALRRADADLQLTVGEARLKGVEYRAIKAHLVVQDGKLHLDPANLAAPGGNVQVRLNADATAAPPTAALMLQAPKLDAAPIAAAAHAGGLLTGALGLDLDLRGVGNTPRAMLPTLTGYAGIALTDGQVGNQALVDLFGSLLRAANLPIDARGDSRVRCLASAADFKNGQADIRAFALDTSRIQLQAEGTVNLVNDTLNLRVRPTINIGGVNVGGPLRLTGPIAAPTPALERGGSAPGRFGFSIGVPLTNVCGPALAAARAPAGTSP